MKLIFLIVHYYKLHRFEFSPVTRSLLIKEISNFLISNIRNWVYIQMTGLNKALKTADETLMKILKYNIEQLLTISTNQNYLKKR